MRPAKLADAVAQHFRQLILAGGLAPGERLLSERELCIKLEVSRPSLRAALDQLIELDLLTTDENGACYVNGSIGKSLRDPLLVLMEDPDAQADCMEFRSIVEASAAEYAAERASQPDRDAIQQQFDRMTAAHERGDIDEIIESDADFHFAIYGASHNAMLFHVMRSAEAVVRSNVQANRHELYENRQNPSMQLAEHAAILEAILARDPARAGTAAREHMTATIRRINAIKEGERRLETTLRRLSGQDFTTPRKGRKKAK